MSAKVWSSLLVAVLYVFASCLIALGFNTLDWILHLRIDLYKEYFLNPFMPMLGWTAYFFFGVVPLAVGGFILGFLSCWLLTRKSSS